MTSGSIIVTVPPDDDAPEPDRDRSYEEMWSGAVTATYIIRNNPHILPEYL
jgi:hypothetical protein